MKNEAVGAVIMASGLARRFGSNKLLADFGGEPMLCRALAATAGIAPRLVITRSEEVQRLCTALGVPVLLHALPHRSDTVRLGLSALLRGQPALLHLPEGKGGGAVLRQHTECVRLFAAGHPAELEDADTPEALQKLLTQEAALKKILPEAGA